MPSLTLGEAFVPGSDEKHFCKPTDVAVSSSGIFFVSDGYCNKRIMKFDPNGRLLKVYTGSFNIVHSLTLQEEKDALCVADRENSRVVCIHAGLKEGPGQSSFGSPYGPAGYKGKNVGRVFAVAAKGTEIKPVNDTQDPPPWELENSKNLETNFGLCPDESSNREKKNRLLSTRVNNLLKIKKKLTS